MKKTFRECESVYLVFTGKEADDEIYEVLLFSIDEEENGEKATLVTDVGRLVVDRQDLDSTEIHYDTGINMFTDRTTAENWHKKNK